MEIAVGKIQTHFPEILEEIRNGNKVGIMYDGIRTPVAMIVPYIEEIRGKRKIGILDGKISIEFSEDFEMTTEELLEMQ